MTRQFEMAVKQDGRGGCYVEELNVETKETRQVAVFPEEMRIVTVKGEFGPELMGRDMAQIRAIVFVQVMDRLLNDDKVRW